MIPVFLLLNVVYLLNLLSINSILILTLPLVFFPFGGRDFFGNPMLDDADDPLLFWPPVVGPPLERDWWWTNESLFLPPRLDLSIVDSDVLIGCCCIDCCCVDEPNITWLLLLLLNPVEFKDDPWCSIILDKWLLLFSVELVEESFEQSDNRPSMLTSVSKTKLFLDAMIVTPVIIGTRDYNFCSSVPWIMSWTVEL